MGTLRKFKLDEYIHKYGLIDFVETGTWLGDAVDYAIQFNFNKIYSIELLIEYYEKGLNKFKNNKNVVLYNNNSIDGLKTLLSENKLNATLFWLDAHLPDLYDKSFKPDYKDKKLSIPLEEELKVIIENKDISKDVFICDDLRIYERGPFEKGEWHGAINAGIGGIEFIHNLLGKTHVIQKNYKDEGYIICLPK